MNHMQERAGDTQTGPSRRALIEAAHGAIDEAVGLHRRADEIGNRLGWDRAEPMRLDAERAMATAERLLLRAGSMAA